MTFKSENELVPANEDELQIIKELCDTVNDLSEPDGKQKWWGADCITEHRIEVLPGTDIFYVYTPCQMDENKCGKGIPHKDGDVYGCSFGSPIWRREE
tara:strand:- start:6523 stop:6816 length:294 start_codon:yes stop_codon:yes gene_type:complete